MYVAQKICSVLIVESFRVGDDFLQEKLTLQPKSDVYREMESMGEL